MKNECDISVIIAAGRKSIEETLDSLLKQVTKRKFEIIVVTELKNLKIPKREKIRFYKSKTKNPAIKRNTGARKSNGKILAFIDDDALAPKDWLENAFKSLNKNKKFSGLGGPNIIPQNANYKERLSDAILESKLGSGHIGYSKKYTKRESKLGEIHLVNFFVKKSAFSKIGSFNEKIGYGAEDTEFLYRAKKMGHKFLYDSDVFVYHHRREFGMNYLKQRFIFRTKNGKLSWVYPDLYLTNPKFIFIIILGIIGSVITIMKPIYLLYSLAAYLLIISIYVIMKKPNFFPILVFAFFLNHVIYFFGFYIGLLQPVFNYKSIKNIKKCESNENTRNK